MGTMDYAAALEAAHAAFKAGMSVGVVVGMAALYIGAKLWAAWQERQS